MTDYTRRRFGGRQPLCGIGVTSSMILTVMPAVCRAVIALSRPEPGPFTRTSSSLTPYLAAFSAACWPAHWPAKGVLFLLPLKPQVPALAQQRASPLVSVIVTTVLLNVALTCAIAIVTLRRTFFFLTAVVAAAGVEVVVAVFSAAACATGHSLVSNPGSTKLVEILD